MYQGHVSAPPYTGINHGDKIIRRNTVELLLKKYTSLCKEDYQSRPFKEYEPREPNIKRDIWREILVDIGLEREVRNIESGVAV